MKVQFDFSHCAPFHIPCLAITVRLASAGDAAEWEMTIALNLTAPLLLTKAFAAGMVKNKVCCQQHSTSAAAVHW